LEAAVNLVLSPPILRQICQHGEACYPEEGAGLLLGRLHDGDRLVLEILPLSNAFEAASRRNRYFIGAREMMRGEEEAERRGMEVLGVFHSHPDHPARPSIFDREHALPWFSYVITSVNQGVAGDTRAWRLSDGRTGFSEERMAIDLADTMEEK
jgi:proteasome lid subunit RPN8/RPN11